MKRYLTKGIFALAWMTALLLSPAAFAQNRRVTGVVTDTNKQPIVGATVLASDSNNGTTTGPNGEYAIDVPADATLAFSFIGYMRQEQPVGSRTTIDVTLMEDQTQIEDVVVVGYGTQKRGSITGAVAAVRGDEMVQTKNENPQNMLAGRIPGVRVWQKSAEPGSYSSNFDIRGMGAPLVIIDGVPRTMEDFQRMNAQDIEDVSVLKDAAAAIYGMRAGNGVVLVTTKKGSAGAAKVTYNGSFTFQKPSGMPVLANAVDAMTIYNEQKMHNVDGGNIVFTPEQIEAYRNGSRKAADWTGLVFSDFSPQTQHDISISGGSEKIKYYVGMGYFFQEGFFRSGDLNYNKFNLRSNISAKIVKGVTMDLNLSGFADKRHTPYTSSVDLIRNYWKQGVLFPAYADPDNTMLNFDGLDLQQNTIAMMTSDVSGYREYRQKQFQSAASLTIDLGAYASALQGLSLKGMLSYDYRMDNNKSYRKAYSLYAAREDGTYEARPFDESHPSRMTREFFDKEQRLGQLLINYDRTFSSVHHLSGVIGWEVQKREGDNFYAQRDLAYSSPYLMAGTEEGQIGAMRSGDNDIYEQGLASLFGRVNYSYDNRYLIEAQFRYDGNSKFKPGHQWGFFPSVSAGWRISEEPFFKNGGISSVVDQLKLRVSYGEMGDESGSFTDWINGYTYPGGDPSDNGYYSGYAPGFVFGGSFVYSASPLAIPNADITWYTLRTFNVGIDFEAWNGKLGISFDYFNRKRSGLMERRGGELPTIVGATAPLENVNSDRQFGMELQITHRNRIGDFRYDIKAFASITRQKYLKAVQNGPYANSYDRWRNDNLNNRFQGIQFGYEGAGHYTGWQDIWSYNIYKDRDLLPGDYKYVDWNGDGEINSLDEHPFAFDQTPWMNFSLNIEMAWRNFDLSMLFQGSALGSMEYREPLYSIWGDNGGGILEQYTDRWHPKDPSADPYDPNTEWVSGYYGYTGSYPKGNSTFNRVSTSYLRLKSLEIGYTLPKIRRYPDLSLRVYANAYNLFTITGVKFVDPEHPDSELGRMYPLNKTYTLGLSLSF